MNPIHLGFDGDLTIVTAAAGFLTKLVFYPLVTQRRRIDADGDGQLDDEAKGSLYINTSLHSVCVIAALFLCALAFAYITQTGLFPAVAAALSGFSLARMIHEVPR